MEEVENVVTMANGEKYELAFPSLRKVKNLSGLLEVDLFTDGLKNLRYGKIFQDEKRLMEILSVCFREKVNEDVPENITPSDFDLIVTAFFFRAKIASVKLAGDLDVLRSITGSEAVLNRLKDMNLTLHSSQLQRESRTE